LIAWKRPPLTRGLLSDSEAGGLTIPPSALRAATSLCTREALCCRVQHIFNKDTIASRWVIHKDMGHRTHQFSVLNNR